MSIRGVWEDGDTRGLRSKSPMKVFVWLFLFFCLVPVVLPLSVFVGDWFLSGSAELVWALFFSMESGF